MLTMNSMANINRIPHLSHAEIRRAAPSVFAEAPFKEMTHKYSMIPTITVVDALKQEGWLVTSAQQTIVRSADRREHAKHMLRFRRVDDAPGRQSVVGECYPEIVLLNSHDGSSSYQVHVGFFRLVCSNGLILSDGVIQHQRIRHSGNIVEDVIEGVSSIVKDIPAAAEKIPVYRGTNMRDDESAIFARSALLLRYDTLEDAPIDPGSLLTKRRMGDKGTDLWTTFNVIQENLLRGGIRGKRKARTGSRSCTKGITSIDNNVRLNKALWALTEQMAALKNAA